MEKQHNWQRNALTRFINHNEKNFLVQATPGAGKTRFSAQCAKALIQAGEIDFAIIVVPTVPLKDGFLNEWNKEGLQIKTVLKDNAEYPKEFNGAVVTYQQLPNLIETIKIWARNGSRILFILDEVHHVSENTWGLAAEQVAEVCRRILSMTGTPFRGDGRPISFVTYNKEGKAIADAKYDYSTAVTDNVCRSVSFMTDDGIAEFIKNEAEERGEERQEVRVSEASSDEDRRNSSRVIFGYDSEWLSTVLQKADAKLDEYRSWDADAGGLIICRPGLDDNDDRHLLQVAKLMRKITGEPPEVITHNDPDANAKIERFRKDGSKRWICAVRKISEGVDIKRLRVEVMANCPSTELLFRQMVGRVVRVDDPNRPGDATVFIAKFPSLTKWAAQIKAEAEAGLRERGGGGGGGTGTPLPFTVIGSTHEDGGAISDFGEEYSASEINAAEHLKAQDVQLRDLPVTKIAYLFRKLGIEPEPTAAASEPLQTQKKKLRDQIVKLARSIAIKRNPIDPDFKRVFVEISNKTGAKDLDDLTDNHSIDVMRQTLEILKAHLGGSNGS